MAEKVKCPVCAWPWDGERETCPHCDFPIADFKDLLAGERIVWDAKLKPEFDDLLAKHRKVYEEREKDLKRKPDELVPKGVEIQEGVSKDPKVISDSVTETTKTKRSANWSTIKDAVLEKMEVQQPSANWNSQR
jgi:hypothetical protein